MATLGGYIRPRGREPPGSPLDFGRCAAALAGPGAGLVYILYFAVGIASVVLGRVDVPAVARGLSSTSGTVAWIASTLVCRLRVALLTRLVSLAEAVLAVWLLIKP